MANALDATSAAIGGGIDLLPVVLALPLLGTLLLLVLGGRLSARASGWLATTMVGLAFLAATVVGADYLTGAGVSASDGASGEGGDHALEPVRQVLWHWMAVGEDLAEITLAAHDLPMMAAVPAEAVTTAPALMSDPRAQQLFGPSLSEMWDPEAVVGLTPMAGVVSAGTMLTWYDVAPGPDGFVPARPWTERRFAVDVALQLDGLSLLMVLLVTGVGFLIHLYSIGYMSHDADASRFFVYMSFFVFSMLTLVLAANFLVMFVGWELVGLCSYLLIGFWYSEGANADAGRKAFVVNRVGDFAFLVGLMLIWSVFGSLDYAEVLSTAWRLPVDGALAIAIAALLLAGATGKSAQLPLFVWLPDAMAGPTPVSALIHAATMVTAGVFMIVRAAPLFEQAPSVMAAVAVIGLATALVGGIAAAAQLDIKRWLAYSTVSQLGYMFVAVGAGAYVAGMLHLAAHAFFKALLFLGAGSVMHAMAHGFDEAGAAPVERDGIPADQDMRNMGGLLRRLRVTGPTFLIGGLALAGLFPLVGFFSKDEILLETLSRGGGGIDFWSVLWGLAMLGALVTAFYSGRGLLLVLAGQARSDGARRAVESPATMTVPLLVLAGLTVFGGLLAVSVGGRSPLVGQLLEPVVSHAASAIHLDPLAMALVATAVTVAGLAAAWMAYRRWLGEPREVGDRAPGAGKAPAPVPATARARGVAYNAFYVDELYHLVFVRPFREIADFLWHVVDDRVIDGAVNGVGRLTESAGEVTRRLQTGYVRTYLLLTLLGAVLLAVYLIWMVR